MTRSDFARWEDEGGAIAPRLKALQRRHQSLHAEIDREIKRPNPCPTELRRLKSERLYLKDQMACFTAK